jgi:large subunit ribosomal protein L23
MDNSQVIKTIRLSEKGALAVETNNSYLFEVHPKATKTEIKQAVTKAYSVKVVSVNTSNYDGKARRARTTQAGKTAAWKKAFVKLAEGQTINLG